MNRKQHKAEESEEIQFVETVRRSANEIWQAGLGAFTKAREEGSDLFARLVKEGSDMQSRTQKIAGDRLAELADAIRKRASTLGEQTTGSIGRVEEAFEDRLMKVLHGAGIPTRDDLHALTQRIDALRKEVSALSTKPSAKKAVVKKTAAKTAARKSAAAGRTTRKHNGSGARK